MVQYDDKRPPLPFRPAGCLAVLLVVALFVIPPAACAAATGATVTPPAADAGALPGADAGALPAADAGAAAWLLAHVNAERRAAGLDQLVADPALADVAAAHARDMIARQYFAHVAPGGATPATRLHRAGIHFLAAGENLAGHTSVAGAHAMLMASPGHRAVILGPVFTRAGIAVVPGGPYGLMIVEVFIAPPQQRPLPSLAAPRAD